MNTDKRERQDEFTAPSKHPSGRKPHPSERLGRAGRTQRKKQEVRSKKPEKEK